MLPREQAAIALALEVGVSVSRFAEDEDLTAVRGAIAARTREPVVAEPRPEPTPRRRKGAAAKPRARPRRRGKKVFVVHERDQAKRNAMFRFLRAIGLEPIEWSKAVKATKKAAPYIGEILEKAFEEATPWWCS